MSDMAQRGIGAESREQRRNQVLIGCFLNPTHGVMEVYYRRVLRSGWSRKPPSFARHGRIKDPAPHNLVFFVLVRLVHGEAAEFVGDFEQVLVTFVPLGADFA